MQGLLNGVMNMTDKKLRNKIILFAILFFVCLLASLFFSEYIFSKLSQIQTTWIDYLPFTIINSIVKNQLHAIMFLSISMIFILILILIMTCTPLFWEQQEAVRHARYLCQKKLTKLQDHICS